MIKSYYDEQYNFRELFNTKTGTYIRSGIINDNGVETNIDPFMRSFPSLVDIGIMGRCVHGKSGLCEKAGIQCYQDAPHSNKPNMTLENFKKIIDEGKEKGLFQVSIGGAGDPDMHENFEEIIRYAAENHIVPNFTTSGLGMTKEKANICKKWCGAVAISQYSRLDDPVIVSRKTPTRGHDCTNMPVHFTLAGTNPSCIKNGNTYIIDGETYTDEIPTDNDNRDFRLVFNETNDTNNYTINAIQTLLAAGVKTNIHFVLGNNTIDEAITRLKYNGFPKGINAVIFLLHKPVGLGKHDNVLKWWDKRLEEFFNLVNTGKFPFKIGFDSCTVPAIINMTDKILPESIDSCEGGRYSMYITADMKALPCSFDNQDMKWAYDISDDTIQNALDSEPFNLFREHFVKSCPNCPDRASCYGGCPICQEITICHKDNKDLQ